MARSTETTPPAHPVLRVLHWLPTMAQAAALAGLSVLGVLCAVVYDRSFFDDTCYHIPIAVEMAVHNNPYYVDLQQPFTAHWFPGLAEAVVAVILKITRSLRFANSTGVLVFLAILWVVWRFSSLWTQDRRSRLSCVALAAAAPLLIAQTNAFYNDIHFGLLAVSALYFLTLCFLTRRSRYGYWALAMVALSAGTKYYGLYYAAILTPLGLVLLWKCRRGPFPAGPFVVMLACALVSTGFYVRNLVTRGNPFFPIWIPPVLRPVLGFFTATPYSDSPDVYTSPVTRWPYPWIPTGWRYDLVPDITHDAYGLSFPLGVLLTLIGLAFASRLPSRRRRAWFLLIGTSAFLIAVFPFHLTVPRYLCFLPLIAALAPAVLHRAGVGSPRGMGPASHPAVAWLIHASIAGVLWAFLWWSLIRVPVGTRGAFPTCLDALSKHQVLQIRQIRLPPPGHHLRLGYVGGYNNFVSLLYDDQFTNLLVPLHFRPYICQSLPYTEPDEKALAARALELKLDGIHIFDSQNSASDVVNRYFRDKLF